MPTTAIFVLFILDLSGYNNLIRHSNSIFVDILLLSLLEVQEQIITDRNTKTNYQITNSANHLLTILYLSVNATTFGNCGLHSRERHTDCE